MCVKHKVKIARPDDPQLCYDGEYEVLQLFDTMITLDSWLNMNSNNHDIDIVEDDTSDIDIDSDSSDDDYRPQDERMHTAYWIRQHIIDNQHGHIVNRLWKAIVLKKRALDSYWVISDEEVALKCMSREHIRASGEGRMQEDFVKEIAALQHLSSELDLDDYNEGESLHVLTAKKIMVNESNEPNESFAFIVMPYCSQGDIYQRVVDVVASTGRGLSETEAKYWFKQMLAGLRTLQRARLCHRDLSPENFIRLGNNTLVIDFGMCLRIPHTTDGRRYLIQTQSRCGKAPHRAPEIQDPQPFDGHAVDLWATGTVLLYMLLGTRKRVFEAPQVVLTDLVQYHASGLLSADALDMLARMFQPEPENRLTLDQICDHPFLQSL